MTLELVQTSLPGFYRQYRRIIHEYVPEDDGKNEGLSLTLMALFGILGVSGTVFMYRFVRARARVVSLKCKLVRMFGGRSGFFTIIGLVPWESTDYGEWPHYRQHKEKIAEISRLTRQEFEKHDSWARYAANWAWLQTKKRVWDSDADKFMTPKDLSKYILRYVDHNTGIKTWEYMKALTTYLQKRMTGEPVDPKELETIKANIGALTTVSERAQEANDFIDNFIQPEVVDMLQKEAKYAEILQEMSNLAKDDTNIWATVDIRTRDGDSFKGIVGGIQIRTARFIRHHGRRLVSRNGHPLREAWATVMDITLKNFGSRWIDEISPLDEYVENQHGDIVTFDIWELLLIRQAWWTFFDNDDAPRQGIQMTSTAWLENLSSTLQEIGKQLQK